MTASTRLSVLLLSLLACCNSSSSSSDLVIETQYGLIQGYTNGYANIWSSIPFAEKPTGDLRFAPPEPAQAWNAVLNTMDDPPGCMQYCTFPWWACPRVIAEDCLYLNVYAPLDSLVSLSPSALKPVMLFIHGGDYLEGYSGGLLYNATYFVNLTDVIVVSVNYRLGAQGFFYDDTTKLMGNYGYFDQVMAIEWAFNNILQFGGDPNQITIYGESAGGVSVGTHLLNTSNTIIKAAIMESNPYGLPLRSPKTWGRVPTLFKTYAGCDILRSAAEQLKCLRSVSADTLLAAQTKTQSEIAIEATTFIDLFMPWTPTVGTGVIDEQPIFAMQNGHYLKDIPILSGTNRNEGNLFVWAAFPDPLPRLEYDAFLAVVFFNVSDAESVMKFYGHNVSNQSDYRPLLAQITTDGMFRCPNRNVSSELVRDASNKALNYMYQFNHISSFTPIAFPDDRECWDAVCHGIELAYVFEPDLTIANGSYTAQEWQLAQTIGYYWSAMAKSGHSPGNGNPVNPVQWSAFGDKENEMMINAVGDSGGMQLVSDVDTALCAFWDSMDYNWIPRSN